MVAAAPAMPVNPKIAAMMASMKKMIVQLNKRTSWLGETNPRANLPLTTTTAA